MAVSRVRDVNLWVLGTAVSDICCSGRHDRRFDLTIGWSLDGPLRFSNARTGLEYSSSGVADARRTAASSTQASCVVDAAGWRTLGSLGTIETKPFPLGPVPAIMGRLDKFFNRTELSCRIVARPLPSWSPGNIGRG